MTRTTTVASEASSATAEPVDSGEEAVLAAMAPVETAGLALRRRGADSVARGNSGTGAAEPADAAEKAGGAPHTRGTTAAAADGLGHGRWSHNVRRGPVPLRAGQPRRSGRRRRRRGRGRPLLARRPAAADGLGLGGGAL